MEFLKVIDTASKGLKPNPRVLLLHLACLPLNCVAQFHLSSVLLNILPRARCCKGAWSDVHSAESLLLKDLLSQWVWGGGKQACKQTECNVASPTSIVCA